MKAVLIAAAAIGTAVALARVNVAAGEFESSDTKEMDGCIAYPGSRRR